MNSYKSIYLNNFKRKNKIFSNNDLRYALFINNISLKVIIILLLIIYYSTLANVVPFYKIPCLNYHLDKLDAYNIDNTNGLQEYDKYPQISLIMYDFDNYKSQNYSLLNYINNLRNQSLLDIQFFFFFKNSSHKTFTESIENLSNKDKRIKVFSTKKSSLVNIFSELKDNIKGKFILIINKYIEFGKEQLQNCYDYTNGKIQNIFKFLSNTANEFYLIKTKILLNLIDENRFNNNFEKLITLINKLPEPQLNYISIAISPNNLYTIFTYVLMISILSTKEDSTYISFYLILSKDFKKKNIEIIYKLYEQFDLFNITLVYMDDRYKNAFVSRRMTEQTYYRFSLGEFLPNINKIIYLDSDTIVYKDLSKLYNLNFNGKLVLGQVTGNNNSKQTGFYRINNGILLLNLLGMRKERIEEKALKLINDKIEFYYHDQTLMNDYFTEYIGIFPPEYHVRNWNNYDSIKKFNKKAGGVYENEVLFFASKYPTIRHYLGPSKPVFSNKNHIEDWWYFAKKSKYFNQKTSDINKIFTFL